MRPSLLSVAPTCRRVSVTIPGSASAAVTLQSLVVAALNAINAAEGDALLPYLMGGRVHAAAAAYVAGDSTASLPVTVALGTVYEEPTVDFLRNTFVKASGAGSIAATISVYMTNRPN